MLDFCLIVVTHNSSKFLTHFIDCIYNAAGNRSFKVVITDNHSDDLPQLKSFIEPYPDILLLPETTNHGFCRGNNLALAKALEFNPKAILFLNPDAFLTENWLDKAKTILKDESIGVVSGPLWHFDFAAKKPTGLIDSLGIDVTRYGKWFDIGQGQGCAEFSKATFPPAVCGALMLIPRHVIDQLLDKEGFVFDERFFMYKEDIDLCLRIRRLGYSIKVHPDLPAYHCRGWKKDRKQMPFLAKKLSAVNDVRVALKHRWRNLPFSLLKLIFVFFFEYPLQKISNIL